MSIIREIREDDAKNFLSLCRLLEPGKRKTNPEEQTQRIKEVDTTKKQAIFVAEENGSRVGYLSVIGERFARNNHVVCIVRDRGKLY